MACGGGEVASPVRVGHDGRRLWTQPAERLAAGLTRLGHDVTFLVDNKTALPATRYAYDKCPTPRYALRTDLAGAQSRCSGTASVAGP